MLLELHVTNFAIAEQIHLSFGPGFNVLTGETGAGKSIVIGALSLIVGGRAGVEVVRSGAELCRIEALFDVAGRSRLQTTLDELGFTEPDDQLVIVREVTANGRSRCRVNGHLATVSTLARLGEHLIDIHGQHDHQSLLRPDQHLEQLDAFAGSEVVELAHAVGEQVRRYREVCRALSDWESQSREMSHRRDLLTFQCEEIDAANLSLGEEEELRQERDRLANTERLLQRVGETRMLLSEGGGERPSVLDALGEVQGTLEEAAAIDADLSPAVDLLASAATQLQEASLLIRRQHDRFEMDPARLAEVEERIELIHRLKRKYGSDIAAIMAYRDRIAKELADDIEDEARHDALVAERDLLDSQLGTMALRLSRLRQAAAERLAAEVASELRALSMDGARLAVSLEQEESEADDAITYDGKRVACSESGVERAEFLFSANSGEALRPLAKVASGGELSRLMLALKRLMARSDGVPTLIFDEVDAGIGGRTATAVADRLMEIARDHQVLVVTHLAQIASVADRHFHVLKLVQDDRTHTQVRHLDAEDRVAEIARMLDGSSDATTLQRARELLAKAQGDDAKKAG